MANCCACPRQCAADRNLGKGFCGVGDKFIIARADLHCWEEPIISGTTGTGAIFLSGCNLRCNFCQNFEISASGIGQEISNTQMIDTIKRLEDKGAATISFITGGHYCDQIAEVLWQYKPSVPVVFNCGGYESVLSLRKLKGVVDVYLPDFKYADMALANYCSSAPNYQQVAVAAIAEMIAQKPKMIIKNGVAQSGVMIRHLVLPNNVKNSVIVLEEIAKNFGTEVFLSLMSQYTPIKTDLGCGLSRKLKPIEYKIVRAKANKLGFLNGFAQDCESACTQYIPQFFSDGIVK